MSARPGVATISFACIFDGDVEVAEHRLCAAVENLVVNALSALEASGRTDGSITVCCCEAEGCLVVRVEDNAGGGLPPRPEDSEGLGLSNCKDTMEAHGGDMAYADNDMGGTTFTLTIPLRR